MKITFKRRVLTAFAILLVSFAFAQNNVGIGTNTPASSALLELQANDKGFLAPRLTTMQRLSIASPVNGLLVFDTDLNCFYYYATGSSSWVSLCSTNPSFQNYQTAAANVNTSSFTVIPGLSQSVTLSSPSKILVVTNGGIQTTSISSNGFSIVDVAVFINGALMPNGGHQRVNAVNNNGITDATENWSMSQFASTSAGVYILPAGTYTIDVRAEGNALGASALVGGDNTSVLQGSMTLLVTQ
ncbi:MAG: hypothetical protein WCP52_02380 [Bacteroidota bacterium]